MPAPLKPIVYIAFANDRVHADKELGLAKERDNIRAAIKGTPETTGGRDRLADLLNSWDLIATDNLTPRSLTEPFHTNRVAIFHYGGHASPEALLLETEDGRNIGTSATSIVPFLEDQKSLKLIFLNACSTKLWATALAGRTKGALCIIATSCKVLDPIALQFSHDFYNSLAAEATIQDAFQSAIDGINVKLTGKARDFGDLEHETDGLPWALYPEGPCAAKSWKLSSALRNPLLGIPALSPDGYPIPDCPYVSIRGHQKEDAQIFFGRNAEIRQIYDWAIHNTQSDTQSPILLLYGQSGSGKSSLLRAGVGPRLDDPPADKPRTDDRKPRADVGYFRRQENLVDDLNLGLSLATHIADPALAADAWLRSEKPNVILLDQIEEAITHRLIRKKANDLKAATDPNTELADFFNRIVAIFIDPQTGEPRIPKTKARLILSFRKEFLAEIRNPLVDRIPALVQDFWLDRFSEQNIVDIVEGPVLRDDLRAKYKIALEQNGSDKGGFAQYLADRLYDPYSPVATILQLELNRLWDFWHSADPSEQQALQDAAGVAQQELCACRGQKDPLGRDQNDAGLCYSRRLYDKISSRDALRQFLLDQLAAIGDPALNKDPELQLPTLTKSLRLALNKGLQLDLLFEHTSSLATSQRRGLSELKKKYERRISAADLDCLLESNKKLHLLADLSDDPDTKISAAELSQPACAEQETATVLAHDTLAPVVRREFDLSHNPGQITRRILEDRARGWTNKEKGDYLDASDLRLVRKGLRYMRATTSDEKRLLHASKWRRRRHVSLMVLVILAIVVIFANEGRRTVASMRLANAAREAVAEHYDRALLLSAAALQMDPTSDEARDAIASIYESRSDAVTYLHTDAGNQEAMAYAPDGQSLFIAGPWGAIELWDVAAKKRVWSVPTGDLLRKIVLSPDGQWLALSGDRKPPQLWRASDGWKTSAHTVISSALEDAPGAFRVASLAFNRDGTLLAEEADCGILQVWSLAGKEPRPLRSLSAAGAECPAAIDDSKLAFDPADPSVLANWRSTGQVVLEYARSSAVIAELIPAFGVWRGNPGVLAFTADGTRLAVSASDGAIELFDVPARKLLRNFVPDAPTNPPIAIAFSADGSMLGVASRNGSVGIWDVNSGVALKPFSGGAGHLSFSAVFSPDFSVVAEKRIADGDVLLLDNRRSRGAAPPSFGHLSVARAAYSADGKWIATGTFDGVITLWNPATRAPVWHYPADTVGSFSVPLLAFSPDNSGNPSLAFAEWERSKPRQIFLHRLDLGTMRELPDLTAPSHGDSRLLAAAFLPNGQIAAVSDKGIIRIWSPPAQTPVSVIPNVAGASMPGNQSAVAISPDGRFLAVPNGPNIVLWDIQAQRVAGKIAAGSPFFYSALAFAPSSHGASSPWLAVGGPSGFSLWPLPQGQKSAADEQPAQDLAFSPDGNWLAITHGGGEVHLWDVSSGRMLDQPLQALLTTLPVGGFAPGGVAFSPDGKQIVTGAMIGSYRVRNWDLDFDKWTDHACAVANRPLSRDEWNSVVYNLAPYPDLCSK